MIRALFFLAALAVVGLIVTGAIRLTRSDNSITIQIDKKRVAEDAQAVVKKSRQALRKAEATLDREADRQ